MVAEIEPFLGKQAACKLLNPVSGQGDDLLCTIEPVLASFLGDAAAAELVGHVVDALIVRI